MRVAHRITMFGDKKKMYDLFAACWSPTHTPTVNDDPLFLPCFVRFMLKRGSRLEGAPENKLVKRPVGMWASKWRRFAAFLFYLRCLSVRVQIITTTTGAGVPDMCQKQRAAHENDDDDGVSFSDRVDATANSTRWSRRWSQP